MGQELPSDDPAVNAMNREDSGALWIQTPVLDRMSTPNARLESIVIIGETPRATFRTHAESLTVTEGSWLGAQQVAFIGVDRVELVSTAGDTQMVRLGSPAPLE
jgi:hypothetical protein